MKKKILIISTIIILSILTLLMVATKAMATETNKYVARFYHEVENGKTRHFVSVVVPSDNETDKNNNILSQKNLKRLIEAKYDLKGIVKAIYKEDGTTQLGSEENVATESVVELTTGRKITVILYGDVNCDGQINTNDTVTISEYNVGSITLNNLQKKAAKLTKANKDEVNTNDTVRVAYYNVNNLSTNKSGNMIIDEELLPEDEEEIFDINNFITELNENEDKFKLELQDKTININLVKDKQESKINLQEEKIIELLAQTLHNEMINNIEITSNGNTIILKREDSKQAIVNKISELLKNILNLKIEAKYEDENYYEAIKEALAQKTLDDLLTLKIEVKINKESTAKFAEGQQGNYTIAFNGTLFLDKIVEAKKDIANKFYKVTFEKENETIKTINVKVKDRTDKLEDIFKEENNKITAVISDLLGNERITEITLSYPTENTEVTPLTLSKNETQEQVSQAIKQWLENNLQTIFNRDSLEKVIMGDLDLKEFKLKVQTESNIKLEDETQEREYTFKFSADPITITFNWNYKENEEDEQNRTTTATLDHAGVITEENRPKYMVTENGEEKETDIREVVKQEPEENEKYKLLGWKISNTESEEYFEFNKDIIYYNTILEAKWVKIDDIDIKLMDIIDEYNKKDETGEANKIFHLGYDLKNNDAEKIRVDILDTNKNVSEIKNTGLMVSLTEFLTKQNISKLEVQVQDGDSNNLSFTEEQLKTVNTETLKAKIIEILNKLVNGDTEAITQNGEIQLKSLVGKTLTVKINQSDKDDDFVKEYVIVFEEVIKKDDVVSQVITEDIKDGDTYKYTYTNSAEKTNGKLNIEVMHSGDSLKSISGTNVMVILQKLLTDEKVKDVSITYGKNKVQSISELIQEKSNDTTEMKKAITDFLEKNWSKICTCKCCEEEGCTWDKATNNCLLDDNTHIGFKITLSDAYEFDKKETKTANYDLNFTRTNVKVTVHYNERTAEETVKEGLPLNQKTIESKVPKYDPETFKYSLKQICEDNKFEKPYNYSNKVTSDMDLYAELYNIVNTKQDIEDKITKLENTGSDKDSTIDNILREEKDPESNSVTIKIEDETKGIENIYNTALAKVIQEELKIDGVDKIIVKVEGNETPVTFSGIENSDNSEEKTTLQQELVAGKTTLNDVIGKKLTIEIYLNNEEALTPEELAQAQSIKNKKSKVKSIAVTQEPEQCDIKYDVIFEGIITKDKLEAFSTSILSGTIDQHSDKIKVEYNDKNKKDFKATVPKAQANNKAIDVAQGCGGATALIRFFTKNSYMASLEFWTDENENSKSKISRSDTSLGESNFMTKIIIGSKLQSIPTQLGGSSESIISEFNGTHLNIKMTLEKNWKFEDPEMSTFKMYFYVES